MTNEPREIQAVKIALDIIEQLQEEGSSGITELSNELGLAKSTVYNHLNTLINKQYVVKSGDRCELGFKIVGVAEDVKRNFGEYEVVREEVQKLAQKTGEVAKFGTVEHGNIRYVSKSIGENAVETASDIGKQQVNPIYTTAIGKVTLAHLPSDETDEIIERTDFIPRTQNTIVNEAELREQLNRITERGYAIDDEENVQGLRCVAVPVLDDGSVIGALSISGPASRFNEERLHEELQDAVRHSANVIELKAKFKQ
jgi:DNA-binding IclR family transcriptional regulator